MILWTRTYWCVAPAWMMVLMMLPIPLIANDAVATNDAIVATMLSSFDTGGTLTLCCSWWYCQLPSILMLLILLVSVVEDAKVKLIMIMLLLLLAVYLAAAGAAAEEPKHRGSRAAADTMTNPMLRRIDPRSKNSLHWRSPKGSARQVRRPKHWFYVGKTIGFQKSCCFP